MPFPAQARLTRTPCATVGVAGIFALGLSLGCGEAADDGGAETGDTGGSQWAHDADACTNFSVPNQFGYRWENLNHRLSVWSPSLILDSDGCDGDTLAIDIVGGDFTQGAGVSDNAFIRYGWQRVGGETGAQLGAARRSFDTILDPDLAYAYEETVTLSRDELGLREYESVAAFIGGFGLDTGEPMQVPEYPADYDPEHGYVVRGVGMAVDVVALDEEEITLEWSIRYEPGLSNDRPDLNDAVPHALIAASMDVVLVGASGAAVLRGGVDYMNEYPKQEVGMEVLLEHPSEEQQRIALSGRADAGQGLWGLTAFDWQFDPAEMAGGGHYMRELDVSIQQETYDDATGEATFLLDGFASNSSQVITSFALRSHFVGSIAWIQAEGVGDPESVERERMPGPREIPLP